VLALQARARSLLAQFEALLLEPDGSTRVPQPCAARSWNLVLDVLGGPESRAKASLRRSLSIDVPVSSGRGLRDQWLSGSPRRSVGRTRVCSLHCRTTHVLPMQLRIGDRFTDSTGECEVISLPRTTVGGKNGSRPHPQAGSGNLRRARLGRARADRGETGNLMAFLSTVVAVVLLTAVGCSSVSVCLEQEKGVSASEDARSQGCEPTRLTR